MQINIAKIDTEIQVPAMNTLPATSQEYLEDYAWRQVLNDAVAAIAVINGQVCINKKPLKDTPAEKFEEIVLARVNKKLDLIIKGEVRIASARQSADPVREEAILIVYAHKAKEFEGLAEKAKRAKALEYVNRNPAYTSLAQANLDKVAAERAAMAEKLAEMEAATIAAGLEEAPDESFGPAATFEANNPIAA